MHCHNEFDTWFRLKTISLTAAYIPHRFIVIRVSLHPSPHPPPPPSPFSPGHATIIPVLYFALVYQSGDWGQNKTQDGENFWMRFVWTINLNCWWIFIYSCHLFHEGRTRRGRLNLTTVLLLFWSNVVWNLLSMSIMFCYIFIDWHEPALKLYLQTGRIERQKVQCWNRLESSWEVINYAQLYYIFITLWGKISV